MANSKINGPGIVLLTDPQAADPTRLIPMADPTSGIAGAATLAQLKAQMTVLKYKYVATGGEGATLTIGALAGKTILLVTREASILHEVTSPTVPDTGEFTWDTTHINLGLTVNPGGG